MPLISENKLYKIGVFNLCCDSNKITVFHSSVVLVEARLVVAPYGDGALWARHVIFLPHEVGRLRDGGWVSGSALSVHRKCAISAP